jgi:ATP-dependent DNA helicase RecQ
VSGGNVARQLATALNLPFHLALEKTDDRPEQKTMANSSQQARNIDGSLAVNVGTLPAGPVLLVDDMVDSCWTLTVAAWLLTANGCRLVYPLALALPDRSRNRKDGVPQKASETIRSKVSGSAYRKQC